MMEHYDRAVCATELRLRNSILLKIRDDDWQPSPAFQVPVEEGKARGVTEETTSQADVVKREPDTASDVDSRTSLGADADESDLEEVDISDLFTKDAFL